MNQRSIYLLAIAALLGADLARPASAAPEAPKPGWVSQNPADLVKLDSGRRNPLFYVGEDISFKLSGPSASLFIVRDFRGDVVERGSAEASTLKLTRQPPGWYKLYIFGKPIGEPATDPARQAALQYRNWYGDAVGGTNFVVLRNDPHFPKLPPRGKYPDPSTGDEVMRGVSGMGPQRHSADASKPEESIKNLEREIATDRELYLPFDPVRKRVLLIAFPNGTKGHLDGVKKIVEHFKGDVTYFEPRNEPNFGASGGDFVKNELADFYRTVKSVDPALKVLGPGNVTIGPGGSGSRLHRGFSQGRRGSVTSTVFPFTSTTASTAICGWPANRSTRSPPC